MARTVAQAEAELRVAALDYAEAEAIYSESFRRNGDFRRPADQPMCPETQEKVSVCSQKEFALTYAAKALREAVRAELRAEAL